MKSNGVNFSTLVAPLIGMPVSRSWKGWGSALFLELGKLTPAADSRLRYSRGQACISLNWYWRLENVNAVIVGSSDSGPKIEQEITVLDGQLITATRVEGRLPELTIEFSSGMLLRSMAMQSGDPCWHIRLIDGNRLFCEAGSIIQISGESETSERSEEEQAAMDFADQCEERWGDPRIEPVAGQCKKCRFFRFVDMDFMVDYGVCTNADSGLDGRVVSVVSGCPSFHSWQA